MGNFISTKVLELGSCAFRQWRASEGRHNAGENSARCSKLHGYRLKAKFWFECNNLDERNWVVDFGGLGELKRRLKSFFDHTTTIASDDPLLEDFKSLHNKGAIDLRIFDNGVGIERVAEFCYKIASSFLKEVYGERCRVKQVEVFEHENNSAIYAETSNSATSVWLGDDDMNSSLEQPLEGVDVSIPTHYTEEVKTNSRPAVVGSNVSTGKSNWFSGTTWG